MGCVVTALGRRARHEQYREHSFIYCGLHVQYRTHSMKIRISILFHLISVPLIGGENLNLQTDSIWCAN